MKTSLGHLPKGKRNELERIASIIRDGCDRVEMIILFGSYARGDYKEEADLEPDRKSGHKSDYDILVVTTDRATADDGTLWSKLRNTCDRSGSSTHVRIIPRDIAFVNAQLAEGQYFFSDVKREGRLLYDSGNHKLARKRSLRRAEQWRIAKDFYDSGFETASGAFTGFGDFLKRTQYKWAAFMLHQAAEASYKTILSVFTNYIPNEHFLGLLSYMAARHEAALRSVFPMDTKEKERLFKLLDYAYIGARYDPEYRITREELEYLSERVKLLLELTEKVCTAQIDRLAPRKGDSTTDEHR